MVAEAVNAARDLQNRPANDLTPTALAAHAQALAREVDGLSVEVEGREEIAARGMGAFAAVAQGSDQEPALITLRYEGAGASGPVLGFVGKAVTFDSGGISLKPGGENGRDEVRHVRRRRGDRGRGGDRAPAAAGQAGGRRRRDREPARAAMRSSPATSSRRPTARRSRSTTPTQRDGWCSPTASATRSARAPSGSSTWPLSPAR